jgi:Na+/pantothenate symporter
MLISSVLVLLVLGGFNAVVLNRALQFLVYNLDLEIEVLAGNSFPE